MCKRPDGNFCFSQVRSAETYLSCALLQGPVSSSSIRSSFVSRRPAHIGPLGSHGSVSPDCTSSACLLWFIDCHCAQQLLCQFCVLSTDVTLRHRHQHMTPWLSQNCLYASELRWAACSNPACSFSWTFSAQNCISSANSQGNNRAESRPGPASLCS